MALGDDDSDWESMPTTTMPSLPLNSNTSFQTPGDDEWDSDLPTASRAPLKENNASKSFRDISKKNKARHVTGDDCPIQFELPKREPVVNDEWEEEEPIRNNSFSNNQRGGGGLGFNNINRNGRGGRGRGFNMTQYDDDDELNDQNATSGSNNRGMNRGRGGGRGIRGNRSRGRGGEGGGETRGSHSHRINRNSMEAKIHDGPREPYVPPEINDSEELLKYRLSKYANVQPNYEPFESKEIQASDLVECFNSFESMGLMEILLENIQKAKFDMPMPIQM